MLKFFARFLLALLFVSMPIAGTVAYIHHANRPDLRPVAMPPPLVESTPYERRIAAEKRFQDKLRAEYARGYKDGLKGRQAQP